MNSLEIELKVFLNSNHVLTDIVSKICTEFGPEQEGSIRSIDCDRTHVFYLCDVSVNFMFSVTFKFNSVQFTA